MVGEHDTPTETVVPVRTREKRIVKAVAGLSVVVLGVLGFASYKLVSNAAHSGKPAAGQAAGAAGTPNARTSATGAPTPSVSVSASATTASASASASASPSVAAARTLQPVSAVAFGPDGTAGGDGVAQAGLVIDGNVASYWRSDWYSTSRFGGLQQGTGLLIDMGRTETVTGVVVVLGAAHGADMQIRAGNSADLASLTRVASSAGAGGTVLFKLTSPVHARYVLLWFTALPPDGVGTYQVQVNEVTVTGQP